MNYAVVCEERGVISIQKIASRRSPGSPTEKISVIPPPSLITKARENKLHLQFFMKAFCFPSKPRDSDETSQKDASAVQL